MSISDKHRSSKYFNILLGMELIFWVLFPSTFAQDFYQNTAWVVLSENLQIEVIIKEFK